MSSVLDLTADQLEEIIADALAAHDVAAAVLALRLLVATDPHRADLVLKAIDVALARKEEQ